MKRDADDVYVCRNYVTFCCCKNPPEVKLELNTATLTVNFFKSKQIKNRTLTKSIYFFKLFHLDHSLPHK